MLPHKTVRGFNDLRHLKAYEGVPPPYNKTRKVVLPSVIHHLALKPRRKFCTVGRLAHEVCWQCQYVVKKLVTKSHVKRATFHEEKKKLAKLQAQALKNVAPKITKYLKIIEAYGFH